MSAFLVAFGDKGGKPEPPPMKRDAPISPDKLHIGRLLKAELERQGRTATWLARQVHCTPENLYKAFHAQWIPMPLLYSISKALGHDFFNDCSQRLKEEE